MVPRFLAALVTISTPKTTPNFSSSHRNPFENGVPVDLICRYPIFQYVVVTWRGHQSHTVPLQRTIFSIYPVNKSSLLWWYSWVLIALYFILQLHKGRQLAALSVSNILRNPLLRTANSHHRPSTRPSSHHIPHITGHPTPQAMRHSCRLQSWLRYRNGNFRIETGPIPRA